MEKRGISGATGLIHIDIKQGGETRNHIHGEGGHRLSSRLNGGMTERDPGS